MATNVRSCTDEEYQAWIEIFRTDPPSLTKAAEMAVKDPRLGGRPSHHSAKAALEVGWPGSGHKPIREVLESEKTAARVLLAPATAKVKGGSLEQALDNAQMNAVQARVEEAVLVGEARTSVRNTLRSAGELSAVVEKLAIRVARELDVKADDPNYNPDPEKTVNLLSKASQAIRSAVAAGKDCIEMERLLLGEPTSITEHRGASATIDEAISTVENSIDAIQRYKDRQERRAKELSAFETTAEDITDSD